MGIASKTSIKQLRYLTITPQAKYKDNKQLKRRITAGQYSWPLQPSAAARSSSSQRALQWSNRSGGVQLSWSIVFYAWVPLAALRDTSNVTRWIEMPPQHALGEIQNNSNPPLQARVVVHLGSEFEIESDSPDLSIIQCRNWSLNWNPALRTIKTEIITESKILKPPNSSFKIWHLIGCQFQLTH